MPLEKKKNTMVSLVENTTMKKKETKPKIQKKKKIEDDPNYEPLELNSLVNVMCEHSSLEYTISLYKDSPLVDRVTIQKAIIRYLMTFDKTHSNIEDKLPKELLEVPTLKRNDEVEKQNKIRLGFLDKVCSSLSKEARAMIMEAINKRFRTKERVNMIMDNDSKDYKRLVRQTNEMIAKIA